jgi:adenine-specific DNA-methyltransferase
MIKYLGSKRTLLPTIGEIFRDLPETKSVIDLFSGTSRVGHYLKGLGFQVHSNDLNSYAYAIASCYVAADLEKYEHLVPPLLKEMSALPSIDGYFTETFCRQSRFFQPKNGMRVDAMREWIERQGFDWELKSILLISLMEAADRVDSTCGIQMAYLKQWAGRAHNDLQLRMPNLQPASEFGKSTACQADALDAVQKLSADAAYLDPPYNQHKYRGNYHIWDSLVLWDKPEFYGVACKRIDIKKHRSIFNKKSEIISAMSYVVDNLDVKHLVVSFNNEGYITREEMVTILSKRGRVTVFEKNYKRYVGAQIGIHSPKGDKVGEVSHLRNKEFIFIVSEN